MLSWMQISFVIRRIHNWRRNPEKRSEIFFFTEFTDGDSVLLPYFKISGHRFSLMNISTWNHNFFLCDSMRVMPISVLMRFGGSPFELLSLVLLSMLIYAIGDTIGVMGWIFPMRMLPRMTSHVSTYAGVHTAGSDLFRYAARCLMRFFVIGIIRSTCLWSHL